MTTAPVRVVVMGVAGAGKTTVAERLARAVGARFVEADDLHPAANVDKMRAGEPLTDEDRRPWLDGIAAALTAAPVVVTCSALKRTYRDVLRRAGGVRFVYLAVDPATATERLGTRTEHFMGPGMVASQFEALEPPGPDERDVVTVEATRPPDEIVRELLSARHETDPST